MARKLRIYSLFWLLQLTVLYVETAIVSQEDTDHYALLKEVGNGTLVSEFQWVIPNMHNILENAHSPAGETIPGPEFYTGQPGYKVRMGVTVGRINPADGLQYMGVWFTLVRGKFDDVVEWPFQYKFNVTLVDQSNSPEEDNIHLSMNPMTAICRLLKQFLRPKTRKREGDGCGKAFFVPHNRLLNEGKFILNGSALIRVTVFLEDRGAIPKRAKAYMRGHQLVSEFLWEIEDIDIKIKQAKEGFLSTITSDLFYVNSESYLMVLQLSIHPEEEHLGLFATLVPGDFDDTLEWPFAYNFELSIADQSPGYLTFDRKGLVDPNSGICSLNSFTKPQYQPNVPCGFRRLLSFHQLESRNFKKNGNLLVRFAAILDQMPNFAAVGAKDGHLVGEYTWRVPNIERKIQLGKTGKMNNILSERFYSNHQGYLMQLQLKFQNVTTGHLGLYLTLLEGEYDSLQEWPFVKKFELKFIDQQPSGDGKDIVLSVDPRNPYITNDACVGSFWRPVGRNDACGSASTVSYETLYTRKYIRYGALLVKVTIFLEEINPPRFGTLTVEDDHVVSTYEWTLEDIDDHIARARKGEIQFIDSEKFYVTNNGYRMMLRLYPEKSYGYIGLYAVLTKGAYDKSLQWPFKYKYQLTMVDQSEKKPRLDISRITYPSTASSGCPEVAFTKPEQELAEWSCGEGRMISHETLNTRGYKKNGGVRVKITVFLKELAPQVASINFHQNAIAAEYSWLVHDVIDRIDLLKAKELMKIESPLFYTSNQGYAIRVSLALNTIAPPLHSLANHKEEFVVGLYVTIFKGKFDEILRWPFPHTILMTLVDQTYSGTDLVKTIDPRNSRCPPHAFDKPRDVQNENACGFAVFVSLERLQSYVKDGAILFRTSIITGQIVR